MVLHIGSGGRGSWRLCERTPIGETLRDVPSVGRILCRGWSGGLSVFVDESGASGRFHGSEVASLGAGRRVGGEWRSLVDGPVGPVIVVVVDVVADEAFELVPVPDDGAVEELAAHRSAPTLSKSVSHRGPDGRLQDLEAFGVEDLAERVDELAGSVSDQGPSTGEFVAALEEMSTAEFRCHPQGRGRDCDRQPRRSLTSGVLSRRLSDSRRGPDSRVAVLLR